MTKGLLYFHQGWTDIFNCLALLNIYSKQYDTLYVVMREDAKPLFEFYIKNIENVSVIYVPYETTKFIRPINLFLENTFNPLKLLEDPTLVDTLYHGYYDVLRKDILYKNSFKVQWEVHRVFFVDSFYIAYNIPYMNRFVSFCITRDSLLENIEYEKFINIHDDD